MNTVLDCRAVHVSLRKIYNSRGGKHVLHSSAHDTFRHAKVPVESCNPSGTLMNKTPKAPTRALCNKTHQLYPIFGNTNTENTLCHTILCYTRFASKEDVSLRLLPRTCLHRKRKTRNEGILLSAPLSPYIFSRQKQSDTTRYETKHMFFCHPHSRQECTLAPRTPRSLSNRSFTYSHQQHTALEPKYY